MAMSTINTGAAMNAITRNSSALLLQDFSAVA
jgi:hypothetical protein